MAGIARLLMLVVLGIALSGCWSDGFRPTDNEYFARTDGITPGAGNAKDANAAVHVIDPWPRQAQNVRIPANGERMVGAVGRYKGQSSGSAAGQIAQPAPQGTLTPGSPSSGRSIP